MNRGKAKGDALDELERVDRAIRARLAEFEQTRPRSEPTADGQATPDAIEDNALHGTVGKNLVEQLALREAALRVVTDRLAGIGEVADLVARLNEGTAERRRALDNLEKMARGVEGNYLNQAQDFEGGMAIMAAIIERDVPQELDDVIPSLRQRLAERVVKLPSARYVQKHAPLHPNPKRRPWERIGPVPRVHAVYDHYRGFPAGGAEAASDVEEEADRSQPWRRG